MILGLSLRDRLLPASVVFFFRGFVDVFMKENNLLLVVFFVSQSGLAGNLWKHSLSGVII